MAGKDASERCALALEDRSKSVLKSNVSLDWHRWKAFPATPGNSQIRTFRVPERACSLRIKVRWRIEAQPWYRSIVMSVTMRQMLEAGVHFGHQTRYRNPTMADFIFAPRTKIHIF